MFGKKSKKTKLSVSVFLERQSKRLEEIENAIQGLQELPAFDSNFRGDARIMFALSSRTNTVHMDVYLRSGNEDYDFIDRPLSEIFDELVSSCSYHHNSPEDDICAPVIKLLEDTLGRVKTIQKR